MGVPSQALQTSRRRPAAARVACQAAAAQGSARPLPLDCSRSLAATRAAEVQQTEPLVADPYAATLVSQVQNEGLGRFAPAAQQP